MTERRINVTIDGDTAQLAVADFRALLSPREQRALEVFEQRCGQFGDVERRSAPIEGLEARVGQANGKPGAAFTVKGHAAIYNRKSLDLGGFREVIAKDAFAPALDSDPHVVLLRDHQPGTEMASTRSPDALLELREDPRGLHFYAAVPDLGELTDRTRRQMELGLVNQASFAFDDVDDVWEIVNRDKQDEHVLRTITAIRGLYDVTITSMGAYPQTDSQVVRAYAVAYATASGRLAPEEERGPLSDDVAPDDPAGTVETPVAPDDPAGEDEGSSQDEARARRDALIQARTRHLEIDRRIPNAGYLPDRGGSHKAR